MKVNDESKSERDDRLRLEVVARYREILGAPSTYELTMLQLDGLTVFIGFVSKHLLISAKVVAGEVVFDVVC